MQLTAYIWPLPCGVVSLLEEEEEEGTTALVLDAAVVKERTGDALKELSESSDVSIDDVSFAIRGKKLELLSNKPIFIIFVFFRLHNGNAFTWLWWCSCWLHDFFLWWLRTYDYVF